MSQKYTIPLIYLTSFLFLFGETLQPAPRIAIYESVVCHQFYRNNASQAADCKVPAVQEELSLLIGMERLSIIIPSILAIPFAALADRVGHSVILSIALFGLFLEELFPLIVTWFSDVFPIRLIWLHFVFSLVGGGFTVIVTLLHVIIARVVVEEERTSVFFRIRAAGVGASVLGYAASGAMMKFSNWLPWIVALVSLGLATVAARLIPITRAEEHQEAEVDDDGKRDVRTRFRSGLRMFKRTTKLLVGNPNVLEMLGLVFLCQLGFDVVPLMLAIYISNRFGWSFSSASFLNSLEMLVELFTLAILLPLLTSNLPSRIRALHPFCKDQIFATGSIAILAIGTLCLGSAPIIGIAITGIVLLALGSGQDSLLRSMATDLAPRSEISIVYSAITMLRAIGGSISGPIYAGLYAAGIRNEVLGLPFLVAGGFFVIALALCVAITSAKAEGGGTVAEEEGETERLLG